MKEKLRSLMHRGNVGSMVKWDMFVINFFFGFNILQLGMMGTSVIYSSGDLGVAGFPNNVTDTSCQNSTRTSWAPWGLSCFVLTSAYEDDQEDPNGTVFDPSFPVGADLGIFLSFHWPIALLQATCPFVTSVGSTQIKPGFTVDDPEVAANFITPLSHRHFTSGGGFSNIFQSDCHCLVF